MTRPGFFPKPFGDFRHTVGCSFWVFAFLQARKAAQDIYAGGIKWFPIDDVQELCAVQALSLRTLYVVGFFCENIYRDGKCQSFFEARKSAYSNVEPSSTSRSSDRQKDPAGGLGLRCLSVEGNRV